MAISTMKTLSWRSEGSCDVARRGHVEQETVDLRFADLTATAQASLAADCLPDSDPDKCAGYYCH